MLSLSTRKLAQLSALLSYGRKSGAVKGSSLEEVDTALGDDKVVQM